MCAVRRIEPDDATLLRHLRLRALEEAPLSFASTFARESLWRDEWADWARADATGESNATFFALEDGEPVGLVAGYRERDDPTAYDLVAMWVDPAARRGGHARALVDAVAGWAAAGGGRALRLWVTDEGARALYVRCGFEPDGRSQPLPHAPDVLEVGMTLVLPAPAS
jgi:GNAT superfamily N-acetyltransferase